MVKGWSKSFRAMNGRLLVNDDEKNEDDDEESLEEKWKDEIMQFLFVWNKLVLNLC